MRLFARAQTIAQDLLRSLLSWATQAVNILLQTFGILFVAIDWLADARKLKAAYLWMVPSAYRYDALELWNDFGTSLSRYLSGFLRLSSSRASSRASR